MLKHMESKRNVCDINYGNVCTHTFNVIYGGTRDVNAVIFESKVNVYNYAGILSNLLHICVVGRSFIGRKSDTIYTECIHRTRSWKLFYSRKPNEHIIPTKSARAPLQ